MRVYNFTLHLFFGVRDANESFKVGGSPISNLVLLLMQVLVYHDLLGMLQHPHHAKVFRADVNLILFSFNRYRLLRFIVEVEMIYMFYRSLQNFVSSMLVSETSSIRPY